MAARRIMTRADGQGASGPVGFARSTKASTCIRILLALAAAACSSDSSPFGEVLFSRDANTSGPVIPRDTDLRTGPDGLLHLALSGTDLWIDRDTDLHLRDGAHARLWAGRVLVSRDGAGESLRLLTPFGEVRQGDGAASSFVAWVTRERVLVTCLAGEVILSNLGHRREARVPPGRTGIVTTGCLAVPARASPWATAAEWTKRFDVIDAVVLAADSDGEPLAALEDVAGSEGSDDADRPVVVALDASADYGAAGVDWACALAEALIDELLPHRFAGLALFDGRSTLFFPYPGPPGLEGAARDARAALWSVEPVPGGDGKPEFLESVAAALPPDDGADLRVLIAAAAGDTGAEPRAAAKKLVRNFPSYRPAGEPVSGP